MLTAPAGPGHQQCAVQPVTSCGGVRVRALLGPATALQATQASAAGGECGEAAAALGRGKSGVATTRGGPSNRARAMKMQEPAAEGKAFGGISLAMRPGEGNVVAIRKRPGPRRKRRIAAKVAKGMAIAPFKGTLFVFKGTGKLAFVMPAKLVHRGLRKIKPKRRIGIAFNSQEEGRIEGPLQRWTNYFRGWQTRWFVMEAPGLLTYYKNHKKKSCLGTISLSNAILTVSTDDDARFVIDTDYGVFYLRTQSENQAEQRGEWIKTIQMSQSLYEEARARTSHNALSADWVEEGQNAEDERANVVGTINFGELRSQLEQLRAEKEKFAALFQQAKAAIGPAGGGTAKTGGAAEPSSEGPTKVPTKEGDGSDDQLALDSLVDALSASNARMDSTLQKALESIETMPLAGSDSEHDSDELLSEDEELDPGEEETEDERELSNFVFRDSIDTHGLVGLDSDSETEDDAFAEGAGGADGVASLAGNSDESDVESDAFADTVQTISEAEASGGEDDGNDEFADSHDRHGDTSADEYSDEDDEMAPMAAGMSGGGSAGRMPSIVPVAQEAEGFSSDSGDFMPTFWDSRGTKHQQGLPGGDDDLPYTSSYSDTDDADDELDQMGCGGGHQGPLEIAPLMSQDERPGYALRRQRLGSELAISHFATQPFHGQYTLPVPQLLRRRLPADQPDMSERVWSMLKGGVGRDLNNITLPATFNEPLSILQRIAETTEHCSLLQHAAKCVDPMERLTLVAVFAMSVYSSTDKRLFKPFNPMLGETFDLVTENLRFVSEQVSACVLPVPCLCPVPCLRCARAPAGACCRALCTALCH